MNARRTPPETLGQVATQTLGLLFFRPHRVLLLTAPGLIWTGFVLATHRAVIEAGEIFAVLLMPFAVIFPAALGARPIRLHLRDLSAGRKPRRFLQPFVYWRETAWALFWTCALVALSLAVIAAAWFSSGSSSAMLFGLLGAILASTCLSIVLHTPIERDTPFRETMSNLKAVAQAPIKQLIAAIMYSGFAVIFTLFVAVVCFTATRFAGQSLDQQVFNSLLLVAFMSVIATVHPLFYALLHEHLYIRRFGAEISGAEADF